MRWLRSLRETRSAAGHRQPMRIAAIAPCKNQNDASRGKPRKNTFFHWIPILGRNRCHQANRQDWKIARTDGKVP